MMMNRELTQAAEMFFFLTNPFNWMNRVVPSFIEEYCGACTWLFKRHLVLVPLCLSAALAKLLIAYYTSVASISIIFKARSMTDAIFNSLALTFIKDLDEALWQLL